MTTEPHVLGERYELGELLGRGGMAEVHLGRDVRLGRAVAVKTLREDLARDPSFHARFRREAQSAASLNHPAIVAVYDTGESQVGSTQVPYIVMEYVEGMTLRELLHSDRRLTPERALEVTAGVLRALEYSHRNNIVHRDIKPANVMLTRHGEVKVMDFGIARAVADTSSTMTQTAAVIGTAQYLSPEQARGERVDARSDLYSTGCLLYELLTGRPPFTGDSPVSVAYQHVREDPVPPSQFNPDVPASVDAIVMKALAKHPDNRYQTAAEMRADVERALVGRPVLATPVLADSVATQYYPAAGTSMLPPVPEDRNRGRRGLVYALLALAALAVIVGLALLFRGLFTTTQRVTVPDVVNLPRAQAEQVLRDKGLVPAPQVTEQFSTQPVGQVISQDPAPNVTLPKGSTVRLTVSKGPQQVTVPDIIGLSQQQATARLASAGLAVGTVTPRNDTGRPVNEVLSADPAPGTAVAPGTKVNLVVSSGNVTVPDVRGKSEADATATLQGLGLQVTSRRVPDANTPAGQVASQSPQPNQVVPAGTQVVIVISEGPPATPTPTPTPTRTGGTPPATTPPATPQPRVTLPVGVD